MSQFESKPPYRGMAIWSLGFRPFFLASAFWAAAAVPIWLVAYGLGDGTVGGQDGRRWHIHEMLFGYGGGVIAGFLLTAVPNWTRRPPLTGLGLAALFALWVAGRVLGLLPGLPAFVGMLESAFLVVLAGIVWREVLASGNRRNLPVCVLVSLLASANVSFYLAGLTPVLDGLAQRGGMAAVIVLIALIGGRVVPSFTQSWALRTGRPIPPPLQPALDRLALAVTVAALVGWVMWPHAFATGGLLIVAGTANLFRLAGWRGWEARAEALVWILHVAYAWLGASLILIGLAAIAPTVVPYSAGVHALTAGSIGTMTMAIMTRATLGHTGQPTFADRGIRAIYSAILLAALVRVLAPFIPSQNLMLLALSAVLWSAAFGGFVLRFGPSVIRPRNVAGKS